MQKVCHRRGSHKETPLPDFYYQRATRFIPAIKRHLPRTAKKYIFLIPPPSPPGINPKKLRASYFYDANQEEKYEGIENTFS